MKSQITYVTWRCTVHRANTMNNLHTAVVKQLNRQKVMQTPLGVDS